MLSNRTHILHFGWWQEAQEKLNTGTASTHQPLSYYKSVVKVLWPSFVCLVFSSNSEYVQGGCSCVYKPMNWRRILCLSVSAVQMYSGNSRMLNNELLYTHIRSYFSVESITQTNFLSGSLAFISAALVGPGWISRNTEVGLMIQTSFHKAF